MSTLSEVEAAVDKLPHPEQEILLEHLARKLGARPTIAEGRGRNANASSSTACGTGGYLQDGGWHSRRSSMTSAVSVADELFGFPGLVSFTCRSWIPRFRELAVKGSRSLA
jgi:hypothetical protein